MLPSCFAGSPQHPASTHGSPAAGDVPATQAGSGHGRAPATAASVQVADAAGEVLNEVLSDVLNEIPSEVQSEAANEVLKGEN